MLLQQCGVHLALQEQAAPLVKHALCSCLVKQSVATEKVDLEKDQNEDQNLNKSVYLITEMSN